MILKVAKLGCVDYVDGLVLQNSLVKLRRNGLIGDVLLLLEHPPVLTIGRRGSPSNIIVPHEVLAAKGVKIYEVNRGGDVTYHGPGQIIGYPIINLRKHGKDILAYLRTLEELFIDLLKCEYAIIAHRDAKYPGVWVGAEKITAIGCAVEDWVTMHGFAFNVNTKLEHFLWINPCGITDKGVTSLQKILGCYRSMESVKEQITHYFCRQFDFQSENMPDDELSLVLRV